jgi:hypothetical protein
VNSETVVTSAGGRVAGDDDGSHVEGTIVEGTANPVSQY